MTVYTQPITISCYIGLNTQPHIFTSLPHRLFITVNIQRPAQCLAHGHKIIHIPWSKCGNDHKIVGPTGFVIFPETDSLLGRTLVGETQTLAGGKYYIGWHFLGWSLHSKSRYSGVQRQNAKGVAPVISVHWTLKKLEMPIIDNPGPCEFRWPNNWRNVFSKESLYDTKNFKIWHLHRHYGLLMADTNWAAKVSILVGLLS